MCKNVLALGKSYTRNQQSLNKQITVLFFFNFDKLPQHNSDMMGYKRRCKTLMFLHK